MSSKVAATKTKNKTKKAAPASAIDLVLDAAGLESNPSDAQMARLDKVITEEMVAAEFEEGLSESNADDSLKMFVRELKEKYPKLSREQERELAMRCDRTNGDMAACEMLMKHNLGLVLGYARRYSRRRSIAVMDLVQAGVEKGIMKAIPHYDYTSGNKFSTYATFWIHQAVSRESTSRLVALPVHQHENISQIKRSKARLAQQLKREPTSEEIAADLPVANPAWTAQRVENLIAIAPDIASLDAPINTEGESTRGDLIEDSTIDRPEDALMRLDCRDMIDTVLEALGTRERLVIQLRYGLTEDRRERTLEEVGTIFGITRERVRQLEGRALKRLKDPARTRELLPYYHG